MAFSERSLTFLSGLREEISRLERDLHKLKKVREALEDYLSEEGSDTQTEPPFPSPEILPDGNRPLPPSREPENRPVSSGQTIGEMAIAILNRKTVRSAWTNWPAKSGPVSGKTCRRI